MNEFSADADDPARWRAGRLTGEVIAAAIEVHRELGPGLLESAYRACLRHELESRGLEVECERDVPLRYRGVRLDCGYRLDLVVERQVVVEAKAVQLLQPVHTAQVLTYLRLTGLEVGLLLNFNVALMKDGVRRMIRDTRGADR
jgi:GxxExxY protein